MSNDDHSTGLTYRDAGVDIDAGADLVERIKPAVKATHRPGVLGGLGGFGGLFELPLDRYKRPVLVSGTDGVGTKLKLAIETGRHDGIGIDLVAMCVNDIVVTGAEPLFFLDYYATSHLEVDVAESVVKGIAEGCQQSGAALIGGETAEMPGMYAEGHYDLAGFAVGIAEKDQLIDGSRAQAGDAIVAVGSDGIHSNGYSLVRRIIDHAGADLNAPFDGQTLADALLAPTRIYVQQALKLIEAVDVKSICHITGGGLLENVPRVLPEGLGASIDLDSWEWPAIFTWLQEQGNVADQEMYRTFNCGIGMIFVVPASEADAAVSALTDAGEKAWVAGEVVPVTADEDHVQFRSGA